jgi:hypothetical protein
MDDGVLQETDLIFENNFKLEVHQLQSTGATAASKNNIF